MNFSKVTTGIRVAVRAALSAALALALAELLRMEFPIYAVIAAVIVTDLSPAHHLRALGRFFVVAFVSRLVTTQRPGSHLPAILRALRNYGAGAIVWC